MAKDAFVVIGIGSSAGGLEALQELFSKIDSGLMCSYVVAQHLSPTHKSMMVDLISKVSNVPVVEVKNGVILRPKTIYITPENTDVFVEKGKVYLKSIEQTHGPKPSVNYFFNSLSQCYGHNAIGIILSGTGSDGAFGIRAIKANGGITIAQSPQSAKYDGMPVSAINTGKVDLVVGIEHMADEIQRLVKSSRKSFSEDAPNAAMQKIYRLLFEKKGVDFSQYKKNTINRRIDRRLSALKFANLDEYMSHLQNEPEEIVNLYHDILIGVTEFFRDETVFEQMKTHLEILLSKKKLGDEVRIWVIGCSTGEEAYTMSVLLHEILKENLQEYKIKIFATDIDDEALKIARSGVYAETSLTSLNKDLLFKYFNIRKNQFEVKKSVRETVIFSKHNVVSDSPFLRLDVVSCRNMLIYFNQNLQERFFSVVHYALKESGLLLLGKSESIGNHSDLFTVIDKDNKIFKAQYTGTKELPKLYRYGSLYKNYEEPKGQRSPKSEEQMLEEKLLEATKNVILNQATLINDSFEVIYVKGDIPFLSFAQGRATNNLFRCLKEELVLDVRTALNEAQKNKQIRTTQFRAVSVFSDDIKYARAIIVPVKSDNEEDWFYALFFQSENIENLKGYISSGSSDNETIDNLSAELARTKSHLQNVIEELESSYEEVQGLNEELSSSNEELQSSNEELETTNEELQSTNEELQTAYSELKNLYEEKEERASKLEDLTQRLQMQTEDLRRQKELTEAIIETTPVAIVKTDTQGKIDFANTNAQNIFKLSKKDLLSRSIDAEAWKIKNEKGKAIKPENLPLQMIQKSFETVHNVVYWVQNGEQNRICLNVSGAPVFDNRGEFVGAVFSIEDITKHKMIEEQLNKYKNKNSQELETIVSKSLEQMKVQNAMQTSSHMQNIADIAVLEISKEFKNKLSELMLINRSLQNQDKEVQKSLLDTQFEILQNLGKSLDETVQYYGEIYSFEALNFAKVMQKNLTLFEANLEAQGVKVENKIPQDIFVAAKEGTSFVLHILQSILALKEGLVVLKVEKKTLVIICDAKVSQTDSLERLAQSYSQGMLQGIFGKSIQKIAVKTT